MIQNSKLFNPSGGKVPMTGTSSLWQAGEKECEIVLAERLASSLLHAVRGDLSVISNELSFVGSQYGEELVASSKNRCRSISARLALLGEVRSPSVRSLIPVRQLVSGAPIEGENERISVRCDPHSITRVLHGVQVVAPAAPRNAFFMLDDTSFRLGWTVMQTMQRQQAYTSLSSFVRDEVGERPVLEAVIADLLVRSHGWQLMVVPERLGFSCFVMGSREDLAIEEAEA